MWVQQGFAPGFRSPRQVAVSSVDGSIVVADYGSERIMNCTSGDGSFVAAKSTGPGKLPSGVAVDNSGTVYAGTWVEASSEHYLFKYK